MLCESELFLHKPAKKFDNLFACVLYKLNGDGLLPTFSRCVREPAVNVAGTEVIVTLLVIILVLAVVAGFLGYQWRMQIDRTKSATSMIKQADSERRVVTTAEREAADFAYSDEANAMAAAAATASSKSRGVTSIWPESQEQEALKSISE